MLLICVPLIGYSFFSPPSAPEDDVPRNISYDGVDVLRKLLSNITGNDYRKVIKFFQFDTVAKKTKTQSTFYAPTKLLRDELLGDVSV
jgi:hypothetical protein